MKRILGLLIGLSGVGTISALDIDLLSESAQLDGETLTDMLYPVSGLMNVGSVELLLDARGVTPYRTLLSQDFATKSGNLVANLTQVAQVPIVPIVPGGEGFAGAGGLLPERVIGPMAEWDFGYGFPWGLDVDRIPNNDTKFLLYLVGKGLADLIFQPELPNLYQVDGILGKLLMNVAVLDELFFQRNGDYTYTIGSRFETKYTFQSVENFFLQLDYLSDSFSMAELAEVVSAVVDSTITRRQPSRQELEAIIGEELPASPVIDAVPAGGYQEPVVPQLTPEALAALREGLAPAPERQAPVPHELNDRQKMIADLNFEGRARPVLRPVTPPAERPLLGEPAKEAAPAFQALQGRDINALVGARQQVAATTNAQKIINLLSDRDEDYYGEGLELDGRQEAALRVVDDALLAEYLADMEEAIERDDFETSDDIKDIKSRLIREHLQAQPVVVARPAAAPAFDLGKDDDEDGAAVPMDEGVVPVAAVVQPRPVPVPAPAARVANTFAWGYAAPKGSGLSEELDGKIDEIAAISGLNGVQKANLIRIVKSVDSAEWAEFLNELQDRSERFSLDGDQVIELAEFISLILKGEVTPYSTGQTYKPEVGLANGLHKAKITALLDREITKVIGNQAQGESADVTKWRQFFAVPK